MPSALSLKVQPCGALSEYPMACLCVTKPAGEGAAVPNLPNPA